MTGINNASGLLLLLMLCVTIIITKNNNKVKQNGGDIMAIANRDIRDAATAAGVRLWRIADALGITDGTLSRRLRHELPQDEKQQVLEVIQALETEVS